MNIQNRSFNKILIFFWCVWWAIAVWTDCVGALAHWWGLKASWAPDVNYPGLVSSLRMYALPNFVPPTLFIIIIIWAALNAVLFARAVFLLRSTHEKWVAAARTAYIVSLCFWLMFFLADQLVMKFDLEQNHMVQASFEFLCFYALYYLPQHTGQQQGC